MMFHGGIKSTSNQFARTKENLDNPACIALSRELSESIENKDRKGFITIIYILNKSITYDRNRDLSSLCRNAIDALTKSYEVFRDIFDIQYIAHLASLSRRMLVNILLTKVMLDKKTLQSYKSNIKDMYKEVKSKCNEGGGIKNMIKNKFQFSSKRKDENMSTIINLSSEGGIDVNSRDDLTKFLNDYTGPSIEPYSSLFFELLYMKRLLSLLAREDNWKEVLKSCEPLVSGVLSLQISGMASATLQSVGNLGLQLIKEGKRSLQKASLINMLYLDMCLWTFENNSDQSLTAIDDMIAFLQVYRSYEHREWAVFFAWLAVVDKVFHIIIDRLNCVLSTSPNSNPLPIRFGEIHYSVVIKLWNSVAELSAFNFSLSEDGWLVRGRAVQMLQGILYVEDSTHSSDNYIWRLAYELLQQREVQENDDRVKLLIQHPSITLEATKLVTRVSMELREDQVKIDVLHKDNNDRPAITRPDMDTNADDIALGISPLAQSHVKEVKESISTSSEYCPMSMFPDLTFEKLNHFKQSLNKRYQKDKNVNLLADGRPINLDDIYVNIAVIRHVSNSAPLPPSSNINAQSAQDDIGSEGDRNSSTSSRGTAKGMDELKTGGVGKPSDDDIEDRSSTSSLELEAQYENTQMKIAVDIENLYSFEDGDKQIVQQFNRIVLLGNPGIGKSTLCRYITYRWSQGLLWNDQFDWIFFIPLKKFASKHSTSKFMSMSEIIHDEFMRSLNFSKDEAVQFCRYCDSTKDRVLFLYDGYDEVAALNHPLVEEILLEQASKFIVTSRPYVKITNRCDTVLEGIGFTSQNVDSYIDKFFKVSKHNISMKSKDIGKSFAKPQIEGLHLISWLNDNNSIKKLCNIPIMTEITCYLWQSGSIGMTTAISSLSGFYSKFIDFLVRRYLVKCIGDTAVENLGSRVMMHPQSVEVIEFLEELSFHASKLSLTVFPGSMLDKCMRSHSQSTDIDYVERIRYAGFLLDMGGNETIFEKDYYFIHLSFQECLAGRYVARKLNESAVKKFIQTQKYNPSMQSIFWYAAGQLQQDPSNLNILFNEVLKRPRDLVGLYEICLLLRMGEECKWSNELVCMSQIIETAWIWFVTIVKRKSYLQEAMWGSRANGIIFAISMCPLAARKVLFSNENRILELVSTNNFNASFFLEALTSIGISDEFSENIVKYCYHILKSKGRGLNNVETGPSEEISAAVDTLCRINSFRIGVRVAIIKILFAEIVFGDRSDELLSNAIAGILFQLKISDVSCSSLCTELFHLLWRKRNGIATFSSFKSNMSLSIIQLIIAFRSIELTKSVGPTLKWIRKLIMKVVCNLDIFLSSRKFLDEKSSLMDDILTDYFNDVSRNNLSHIDISEQSSSSMNKSDIQLSIEASNAVLTLLKSSQKSKLEIGIMAILFVDISVHTAHPILVALLELHIFQAEEMYYVSLMALYSLCRNQIIKILPLHNIESLLEAFREAYSADQEMIELAKQVIVIASPGTEAADVDLTSALLEVVSQLDVNNKNALHRILLFSLFTDSKSNRVLILQLCRICYERSYIPECFMYLMLHSQGGQSLINEVAREYTANAELVSICARKVNLEKISSSTWKSIIKQFCDSNATLIIINAIVVVVNHIQYIPFESINFWKEEELVIEELYCNCVVKGLFAYCCTADGDTACNSSIIDIVKNLCDYFKRFLLSYTSPISDSNLDCNRVRTQYVDCMINISYFSLFRYFLIVKLFNMHNLAELYVLLKDIFIDVILVNDFVGDMLDFFQALMNRGNAEHLCEVIEVTKLAAKMSHGSIDELWLWKAIHYVVQFIWDNIPELSRNEINLLIETVFEENVVDPLLFVDIPDFCVVKALDAYSTLDPPDLIVIEAIFGFGNFIIDTVQLIGVCAESWFNSIDICDWAQADLSFTRTMLQFCHALSLQRSRSQSNYLLDFKNKLTAVFKRSGHPKADENAFFSLLKWIFRARKNRISLNRFNYIMSCVSEDPRLYALEPIDLLTEILCVNSKSQEGTISANDAVLYLSKVGFTEEAVYDALSSTLRVDREGGTLSAQMLKEVIARLQIICPSNYIAQMTQLDILFSVLEFVGHIDTMIALICTQNYSDSIIAHLLLSSFVVSSKTRNNIIKELFDVVIGMTLNLDIDEVVKVYQLDERQERSSITSILMSKGSAAHNILCSEIRYPKSHFNEYVNQVVGFLSDRTYYCNHNAIRVIENCFCKLISELAKLGVDSAFYSCLCYILPHLSLYNFPVSVKDLLSTLDPCWKERLTWTRIVGSYDISSVTLLPLISDAESVVWIAFEYVFQTAIKIFGLDATHFPTLSEMLMELKSFIVQGNWCTDDLSNLLHTIRSTTLSDFLILLLITPACGRDILFDKIEKSDIEYQEKLILYPFLDYVDPKFISRLQHCVTIPLHWVENLSENDFVFILKNLDVMHANSELASHLFLLSKDFIRNYKHDFLLYWNRFCSKWLFICNNNGECNNEISHKSAKWEIDMLRMYAREFDNRISAIFLTSTLAVMQTRYTGVSHGEICKIVEECAKSEENLKDIHFMIAYCTEWSFARQVDVSIKHLVASCKTYTSSRTKLGLLLYCAPCLISTSILCLRFLVDLIERIEVGDNTKFYHLSNSDCVSALNIVKKLVRTDLLALLMYVEENTVEDIGPISCESLDEWRELLFHLTNCDTSFIMDSIDLFFILYQGKLRQISVDYSTIIDRCKKEYYSFECVLVLASAFNVSPDISHLKWITHKLYERLSSSDAFESSIIAYFVLAEMCNTESSRVLIKDMVLTLRDCDWFHINDEVVNLLCDLYEKNICWRKLSESEIVEIFLGQQYSIIFDEHNANYCTALFLPMSLFDIVVARYLEEYKNTKNPKYLRMLAGYLGSRVMISECFKFRQSTLDALYFDFVTKVSCRRKPSDTQIKAIIDSLLCRSSDDPYLVYPKSFEENNEIAFFLSLIEIPQCCVDYVVPYLLTTMSAHILESSALLVLSNLRLSDGETFKLACGFLGHFEAVLLSQDNLDQDVVNSFLKLDVLKSHALLLIQRYTNILAKLGEFETCLLQYGHPLLQIAAAAFLPEYNSVGDVRKCLKTSQRSNLEKYSDILIHSLSHPEVMKCRLFVTLALQMEISPAFYKKLFSILCQYINISSDVQYCLGCALDTINELLIFATNLLNMNGYAGIISRQEFIAQVEPLLSQIIAILFHRDVKTVFNVTPFNELFAKAYVIQVKDHRKDINSSFAATVFKGLLLSYKKDDYNLTSSLWDILDEFDFISDAPETLSILIKFFEEGCYTDGDLVAIISHLIDQNRVTHDFVECVFFSCFIDYVGIEVDSPLMIQKLFNDTTVRVKSMDRLIPFLRLKAETDAVSFVHIQRNVIHALCSIYIPIGYGNSIVKKLLDLHRISNQSPKDNDLYEIVTNCLHRIRIVDEDKDDYIKFLFTELKLKEKDKVIQHRVEMIIRELGMMVIFDKQANIFRYTRRRAQKLLAWHTVVSDVRALCMTNSNSNRVFWFERNKRIETECHNVDGFLNRISGMRSQIGLPTKTPIDEYTDRADVSDSKNCVTM